MSNAAIRLGVVQPLAHLRADAQCNVPSALEYIRQAGELGVDLLLFPETYPGPYRHDDRYEVIELLSAAARAARLDLVAGTTSETEPGSGEYYVEAVVIDREGHVIGRYRRSHPDGPYLFAGGSFWDVNYTPGGELPVFELEWGTLGIAICSEVFVPEIARTLALKGAEVCLFPSGVFIDELGYTENWRTLIRARAIENLMFTATTTHLLPREILGDFARERRSSGPFTAGHAMIASPERVLASTHEPGVLTAELNLGYLRELRETVEDLSLPAPYRTVPGLLGWRLRPELYGAPEGGHGGA